MSEAKERETEVATPNLFEQTKGLIFIGERLSGDPEVLHEIQDWAGLPTSREQIKTVLQFVPNSFPEDWKSPDGFDELTQEQKEAYFAIAKVGPFRLTGPQIQTIIELGVSFRDRFQINKL